MLNSENVAGRFFVQGNHDNNEDFVSRQKNVFEQLDAVLKDNEKSISILNPAKRRGSDNKVVSAKKQKCDTRQFRGQESIFKRPEAPPPSRFKRNIPDYQKNPSKWTKYTLSDVSQEDMSDRSNTAAALSFLKELQAKKESEAMDIDCEGKQITFRKPNFKGRNAEVQIDDNYESPSFRSSKVVMPEYVVGEKKTLKKNRPKQTGKPEKPKEIKLEHLAEEEV